MAWLVVVALLQFWRRAVRVIWGVRRLGMPVLVLVAGPLLDAGTTLVGVFHYGLPEIQQIPRMIFAHLGVWGLLVTFTYELALAAVIYRVFRRWLGDLAVGPAVAGPWIVGWRNLGILLRLWAAGVLGGVS